MDRSPNSSSPVGTGPAFAGLTNDPPNEAPIYTRAREARGDRPAPDPDRQPVA